MPIMIDMEKPKYCEIYDNGTFADCPLLYDANDCKLFADTRCREWLEGWAIESDNCPLKEVVLCKDCKYEGINAYEYKPNSYGKEGWCVKYNHAVADDDFCSTGERREA